MFILDALFTVGEEWICHVIYDHCSTEMVKDVYSTMKVTEHKVTPYFGSQAEVNATSYVMILRYATEPSLIITHPRTQEIFLHQSGYSMLW